MALAVPATLSPSKVDTFTHCALAFRYSVIDRVPEPPSRAAARGTLVHRALEHLFATPADERTPEAGVAHLARARAEVLGGGEYAALALDGDDEAKLVTEAEELVRRYFRIEDPTQVRPIGIELKLEASLGGVRLRGIIDRLDLDAQDELVVTDYKTGSVPGIRHERGRLGGVHFYAYLCQAVFGRRPAHIQLLYLTEPVAIVATPSDQSIGGLVRKVGAVWSAVERACLREDFRPSPGPLCEWCSFQAYCPALGGDPSAVPATAGAA